MKRFLLATTMLAGLLAQAIAADLPAKAPPLLPATPGYPYTGSGLYAGIGVVGDVANSSVAGTGMFAAGAGLDLTAGYQWGLGTNWFAAEASVQYTNLGASALTNVNGVATAIAAKWGFEERVLWGFPLTNVLAVLPNLSTVFPALPALPGDVVPISTTSHPYLYVGLREDDVSASLALAQGQAWQVQPVLGAGLRQQWTQGLVVDTSAGCSFANTGFTVGPSGLGTGANLGSTCRAAVRFLY